MIFIKIGSEERNLDNADQQWITQTISRLRRAGGRVCVAIRFELPGIKIRVATHDCPKGPGGRPLDTFKRDEQRLFKLWDEMGLNDDPDVAPGTIIAFLNRAVRMLGVAA